MPEGIEGRVAYKGPVVGGAAPDGRRRCAPAWAIPAAANIEDLQRNAQFRRITGAGLRESHVHDVAITREAPNYNVRQET